MEEKSPLFRADTYDNDVATYLTGGYVSDRIHELSLICELMMTDIYDQCNNQITHNDAA